MRLSRLLAGLGVVTGGYDPEIAQVTCDSREAVPGALFVALKGFSSDGHLHVREAFEAGASAVLAEVPVEPGDSRILVNPAGNNRELLATLAARFFREPWNDIRTAGITGTNGKTSTAHMLAWILKAGGVRTGIMGTVGHVVAGEALPAAVTTPDSVTTTRLMRAMVDGGDGACVMEVSSHALSLDRVSAVRFDTGVFTNITQDHLDFHGTMDEYLKAKLRLLELLKPGGRPVFGSSCREWPSVPGAVTFGYETGDDFLITEAETGIQGSRYRLHTPEGVFTMLTGAPGTFSILNSAGAAAAAFVLGVPLEVSVAALGSFTGVPGRMERVDGGRDFLVAVDYAHTPDALSRVLTQGRELAEGRLISIFGCGGDRDPGKRPLMGAISERTAHLSIITSDNPRTEDPVKIIEDILSGIGDRSRVIVEPDRRKAIRLGVSMAGPGDVVIIAGKGHEDYQILGTRKIRFDDREEARRALEELE